MKLFLDTEFSSLLAAESQLISLALVAEDGREFYAELPPSTYQKTCSPFAQQTVTPLLWGGRYEMPLATLAAALRPWIDECEVAEIVTDAPSWDFRFLRVALDESRLGWPRQVATGAVFFTPPEEAYESYFNAPERSQHHALHDARALRSAWKGSRPQAGETTRRKS